MSKYGVTQREWCEVMGSNPSSFKGDDEPVEKVSWFDAVKYCNTLSRKAGRTPVYHISGENLTAKFSTNGYRLPTEAEWEYAARGGVNAGAGRGVTVRARRAIQPGQLAVPAVCYVAEAGVVAFLALS